MNDIDNARKAIRAAILDHDFADLLEGESLMQRWEESAGDLLDKFDAEPHLSLASLKFCPSTKDMSEAELYENLADKFLLTTSRTGGGFVWLNHGAHWPTCANCSRPLSLNYQLDLARVSEDTGINAGTGLVQYFRCDTHECDSSDSIFSVNSEEEGSEEISVSSPSVYIRVVEPQGEPAADPDLIEKLKAKGREDNLDMNSLRLKSFGKASVELYDPTELADYLIKELDIDEFSYAGDMLWEELEEIANSVKKKIKIKNKYCDSIQLFGKASWVQEPNYPLCPKCNAKMRVLSKFDYGVMVERLFQCADHTHIIARSWDR
jgi:hypothetical protein